MKKTRSVLCLMLALAMLLSLGACSGKKDPKNPPDEPEPTADLDNLNLSLYGRVAHADGYTYFVQYNPLNDGSVNGTEDAEVIYRISDKEGAKPEQIAVVPSVIVYGTSQTTVAFLCPCGSDLYFFAPAGPAEHYSDMTLFRVDMEAGDGKLIPVGLDPIPISLRWNRPVRDGNTLYITNFVGDRDNSSQRESAGDRMIAVDLLTGKWKNETLGIPVTGKDTAFVVDVCGGYVYYFAVNDEEPYGMYRMRLGSGQAEEIAPLNNLEGASLLGRVIDGGYWFYAFVDTDDTDEEGAFRIDLETGEMVCQTPELEEASLFNVADGKVWYLAEDGLYMVDPAETGTGPVRMISADLDTDDYFALYTGGDRFFLEEPDGDGVVTVKQDSRIFPRSPMVASFEPDWEEKTSGDWDYILYPNYVAVTEYHGTQSKVTVPAEIEGVPVRRVSLYLDSGTPVTELTLPDSLRMISGIYGSDLEKITIPAGVVALQNLPDRVFSVSYDGEIVFAGTKAEWEEICLNTYFQCDSWGDLVLSAEVPIRCSDGTIPASMK